ncbi:MAG TPA: hypothetical protein PKC18_19230 [Lacipirellulaceae bacterium]|nr:hypothetical protein [Lacipirellulaceae bacterium]HMP07024.1 hypothetical protein [Lacipirellulaceae bacterium]
MTTSLFQSRTVSVVSATLALAILLGCGSGEKPVVRDVRDPFVYAGYVKSRVISYLDRVKKKPSLGPEQADFLVSMLQNYKSAPVGDDGEVYGQLLAACQELKGLYQSAASAEVTKKKIEEISRLANMLPGELELGADG